MIANALEDKPLPVYGDGLQVRDWIYVEDHCRAIWRALAKGRVGEVQHRWRGAENQSRNRPHSAATGGKPESLIALSPTPPTTGATRWTPPSCAPSSVTPCHKFQEGLERTVAWYRSHPDWLRRCRSGAYRDYYHRHYDNRGKLLATLRGR
jgi:dTDP-glucose 4,6-dehydratase